jgi:hypothetical protein
MTTPLVKTFGPIDELETDLIESWQAVSRATHRFLVLLREFDLRHGWKAYGNNDCAEWLNWRCGISRTTAQEKLRVARALWVLPQIEEAFKQGHLSYSKVRALTRVANDTSEADLLAFALSASAAQLEAYCRRLRNGDAEASIGDARRLREFRSLSRHFREDGSGSLTVELPREELELVLKALERVATSLPEDPSASLFAKAADALVQMARDTLAGRPTTGSSADQYQVIVHVDAAALSGEGGESDLPIATVRRLCCDGSVVPLIKNGNGKPLNVGRKQRIVPKAIRRALDARDRVCTYPGCHHQRWLEGHHIVHWADGGETSLPNTLLLCSTHHALVHEGGFGVHQDRDGRYYFTRPNGRPVEVPQPNGGNRVEEPRAHYRAVVPSSAEDGSVNARGGPPSAEGGQPTYLSMSNF